MTLEARSNLQEGFDRRKVGRQLTETATIKASEFVINYESYDMNLHFS